MNEKNTTQEFVVDRVGTHRTHCCINHGCKYGDSNCPVETEQVTQEYLCEFCAYDSVDGSTYTVTVTLSVLPTNPDGDMSWLKTATGENIEAAVQEALTNHSGSSDRPYTLSVTEKGHY